MQHLIFFYDSLVVEMQITMDWFVPGTHLGMLYDINCQQDKFAKKGLSSSCCQEQ